MEMNQTRKCLECGRPVAGRIDKKYCCDDCRTSAWNRQYRERKRSARDGSPIGRIEKDLQEMANGKCFVGIKIIALVTRFCKIMYKFGT